MHSYYVCFAQSSSDLSWPINKSWVWVWVWDWNLQCSPSCSSGTRAWLPSLANASGLARMRSARQTGSFHIQHRYNRDVFLVLPRCPRRQRQNENPPDIQMMMLLSELQKWCSMFFACFYFPLPISWVILDVRTGPEVASSTVTGRTCPWDSRLSKADWAHQAIRTGEIGAEGRSLAQSPKGTHCHCVTCIPHPDECLHVK